MLFLSYDYRAVSSSVFSITSGSWILRVFCSITCHALKLERTEQSLLEPCFGRDVAVNSITNCKWLQINKTFWLWNRASIFLSLDFNIFTINWPCNMKKLPYIFEVFRHFSLLSLFAGILKYFEARASWISWHVLLSIWLFFYLY